MGQKSGKTKRTSKNADRKKRSSNQRTGRMGESRFELFASGHYLVPTKVAEDVGIDFLCQVEERTADNVRPISGEFLGAAVRSTDAKKQRVKLNRADADSMLRARYPVCFVLVDITRTPPTVHHRFLDEHFALQLSNFLNSSNENLTLTPTHCRNESDFDRDLEAALRGNRPEMVRLAVAAARLAAHILEPALTIERTSSGELTIVESSDFFSFFVDEDRADSDRVRGAIYGRPDLRTARLAELGPNRKVIDALDGFPAPILTGVTEERSIELVATNSTGSAGAMFQATRVGDEIGWVHPAGFSLTISGPIRRGDRHVHEVQALVDIEAGDIGQTPELWAFLEHCTDDGSFGPCNASDRSIPTRYVNGIEAINSYAVWMRLAEQLPGWTSSALPMRFARDDESLHGLAFLAQMADGPEFIEGFGFVVEVGERRYEFDEHTEEAELPFLANMGDRATVIWMRVTQTAFVYNGQCHGIKIKKVHSVRVEFTDRLDKSTPYPELVVDSTWPTIAFRPGPTQTSSDARRWPVQAKSIAKD